MKALNSTDSSSLHALLLLLYVTAVLLCLSGLFVWGVANEAKLSKWPQNSPPQAGRSAKERRKITFGGVACVCSCRETALKGRAVVMI